MKINQTQKEKFLAILYGYCYLTAVVVVALICVFCLALLIQEVHNYYVWCKYFSQLEIDINEVTKTTNP